MKPKKTEDRCTWQPNGSLKPCKKITDFVDDGDWRWIRVHIKARSEQAITLGLEQCFDETAPEPALILTFCPFCGNRIRPAFSTVPGDR